MIENTIRMWQRWFSPPKFFAMEMARMQQEVVFAQAQRNRAEKSGIDMMVQRDAAMVALEAISANYEGDGDPSLTVAETLGRGNTNTFDYGYECGLWSAAKIARDALQQ